MAEDNRVLPARISIFDLVEVIGIRVTHIENGYATYVNCDGSSEKVAIQELIEKKCPLSIKRKLNEQNGEMVYEVWDVNEMIIDISDLNI